MAMALMTSLWAFGAAPNGQDEAGGYGVWLIRRIQCQPQPHSQQQLALINGIDAGDHSGGSVQRAMSMAMALMTSYAIGRQRNAGESYVVFGSSGGFSANLNLSTSTAAMALINGIDASDFSGFQSVQQAMSMAMAMISLWGLPQRSTAQAMLCLAQEDSVPTSTSLSTAAMAD